MDDGNTTYTIIRKNHVLFKGKLSPLSNFYERRFMDDYGIEYRSLEHFFQCQKALTFHDIEAASQISGLPDGLSAKYEARKIKNFNEERWDAEKNEIMYKELQLKFQDEFLRDFLRQCYFNDKGGIKRTFLENSGNRYWGCKVDITSPYINYNNLKGENNFGKLLEKLCKELFE